MKRPDRFSPADGKTDQITAMLLPQVEQDLLAFKGHCIDHKPAATNKTCHGYRGEIMAQPATVSRYYSVAQGACG